MSEQRTPEKFAVGEVVIYCRPGSIQFGAEVTIVGPLKDWRIHYSDGTRIAPAYLIDGVFPRESSMPVVAEPHHLRKKRPPTKDRDVVRWADCPWQPEALRV